MNEELSKQMSVRFKRFQKTYFIIYDEYQLFLGLKKKFCELVGRPQEEVTFYLGDRVGTVGYPATGRGLHLPRPAGLPRLRDPCAL